jgi:hypothetical protein
VKITPAIRKTCIVGATYTYTAKICGTASMPPITPRLHGECVQRLLTLLTKPPANKAIQDLEREIRYCDPFSIQGKRLIESQKRKIELLRRDMVTLSQEEASKQISNLALMRGITRLDTEDNFLFAETAPIVIETTSSANTNQRRYNDRPDTSPTFGVYLGAYRIYVDTLFRRIDDSIKIDRIYGAGLIDTVNTYIHPHLQKRHICWGNFATTVENALQKCQVDLLITMVLQHLNTYNTSSPYTPLSTFNSGGSYDVRRLERNAWY